MKPETRRARGNGRQALDAARLPVSLREAAIAVAMSPPMIVWARRILRQGCVELIVAVEEGRIALYVAGEVAKYPEETQRNFLGLDAQPGLSLTLTRNVTATSSHEHEK